MSCARHPLQLHTADTGKLLLWKLRFSRLPCLFLSIALLVLSQLAISEASVERGFAVLEATVTEARNQLSDARVQQLMFLGNREVYETTVQEPNFTIDQPDAEHFFNVFPPFSIFRNFGY